MSQAMTIKLSVVRTPKGFDGTILVPLTDGRTVAARGKGRTKAQALGVAAKLAKQIEGNDVLAALLPPQATIALKAASALSKAAQAGQLASVAKKYAGPAMKRLSKLFG